MQERFNQNENYAKAWNSKMGINYLKLYNIKIPNKLDGKRDAVRSCKESASNKVKR